MAALLTFCFISLLRYSELKSPNNIKACNTEDVHSTVLPMDELSDLVFKTNWNGNMRFIFRRVVIVLTGNRRQYFENSPKDSESRMPNETNVSLHGAILSAAWPDLYQNAMTTLRTILLGSLDYLSDAHKLLDPTYRCLLTKFFRIKMCIDEL